MLNTEQKGTSRAGNQSLGDLELKANLNEPQREYLDILKDKMKKILGNKTKQELAKAGDLVSLKRYKAILEEILEFLRTKKMFREIKYLEPGGGEVLEKKEFSEAELIGVILEAENYNVEPENIRCIRETRTTDNVLVSMDFVIKGIPNLEYTYSASYLPREGSFGTGTSMFKVFLDNLNNDNSEMLLSRYIEGRWFYTIPDKR